MLLAILGAGVPAVRLLRNRAARIPAIVHHVPAVHFLFVSTNGDTLPNRLPLTLEDVDTLSSQNTTRASSERLALVYIVAQQWLWGNRLAMLDKRRYNCNIST